MPHFCITPSGQIINLEKVVAVKPYRDDSDKFFVRVFVDSQLQVIILEGEDAEYFCSLAYFRDNVSTSYMLADRMQAHPVTPRELTDEEKEMLTKAMQIKPENRIVK